MERKGSEGRLELSLEVARFAFGGGRAVKLLRSHLGDVRLFGGKESAFS